MLAPSRRWLSRPRTLLFFSLCVAGLYFFLVNGSSSQYSGAWTADNEGKEQPASSNLSPQPNDDGEVVKPDSPEIATQTPPQIATDESPDVATNDPEEAHVDKSPSVKNKEDQIKEEYEREYEKLGK